MKKITTDKAPAAIGAYSQAVSAGGFLYASGQLGVVPKTGELQPSLDGQINQAIKNLSEILSAAGVSLSNVVKTTCFLTDMADFAVFNKIYEGYFPHKPARSCVAVAALPKGALFEIESVAVLGE